MGNMTTNHFRLMLEEDGNGATGGGAATVATAAADDASVGNVAATATTSESATSTAATGTETSTDKTEGTRAYWAEDWRQKLAGDDEKALKQLTRYASPEEIWKKTRALEQRLSSGELKANLPKNAGEEEVKAWRLENGIPDTYDKYDIGFKPTDIAEADKELVELILKNAHQSNQTNEQVKASVSAFKSIQTTLAERQAETDLQAKTNAEETLRAEWGGEFRRDINLINGLLDKTGGPELKQKFLGGRLSDGTPIGSSPEALKMLLSIALADNPAGIVVPNAGGNLEQTVDSEIEQIEKKMRDNRKAYDNDEKIQARYRDLLEAREQFKKRK